MSWGADRAWWFGRSSKPRRRRLRLLRWVRFPHAPATLLWALAAGSPAVGGELAAQAPPGRPAVPPAAAPDTSGRAAARPASRQLKPLPAFFHSLLIPGWGQALLDRKLTATLFVAWEGVSLGMSLKAAGEVRFLRRIDADSSRIEGKKREREDWLVMLAFNHLFSGLEAYVGSELHDFPGDLRFRPAPYGVGIQAVMPFRIR